MKTAPITPTKIFLKIKEPRRIQTRMNTTGIHLLSRTRRVSSRILNHWSSVNSWNSVTNVDGRFYEEIQIGN